MKKNEIMIVFFIFVLILILAVPSFSAEKKFRISIGVHMSGLWIPANKVMRDVYGTVSIRKVFEKLRLLQHYFPLLLGLFDLLLRIPVSLRVDLEK